MPTYQYDVFISYASPDRAWAEKLRDDLIARGQDGQRIFLDSSRLIAGKEFENQLIEALKSSRCLVVLWSKNARASDWVAKETGYFDVSYRADNDRNLIILALDDEPRAFASLQAIYDIKQAGAYGSGPDKIEVNLWSKVLTKITDSLLVNDNRRPIQLAVLTTTRPRLQQVDFDKKIFGASLNDILQQSGLGITKQQILDSYGDEYGHWKPFGGEKYINTVLEDLLQGINRITKRSGISYRWLQVDQQLLYSQHQPDIQLVVNELAEKPSVIIIDPISLFDDDVLYRFNMLNPCYENKDSLIMTFSPFRLSADIQSLRSIIERVAWTFHSNFFEPPIPSKHPFAQIYANPVDEKDAQRLLRFSLSNLLPGGGDRPGIPFFKQ